MQIEEVTVTQYKVGGLNFETRAEARQHQARLALDELINDKVSYADYKTAVDDFINSNLSELHRILGELLEAKNKIIEARLFKKG